MAAIWAAAIAAVGGIASSAMKSKSGPAGAGGSASDGFSDGRTTATQPSAMFDNSGWNVTFGDNSGITAPTTNNKSLSPTQTASPSPSVSPIDYGLGSGLAQTPSAVRGNWVDIAVIFFVAMIIMKKVKK